jgi:hypothetical protein
MISEKLLTTLSSISCENLRRFLTQYEVPADTMVESPNYRAILDLIRWNPTLSGAPSALTPATTEDVATSTVTPTVHHVPHVFAFLRRTDHSRYSVPVHAYADNDAVAGDAVSNWASVPALQGDSVCR